MAISKRTKAGRTVGWQVAVVVPNPSGGRGKRFVLGTYRTKGIAEQKEREAKDQIARGTFVPPVVARAAEPPKVTTVASAVTIWFDTKRGSITANSAVGYESAIRLHILPALGGRDVTELTHDDVQRQVNVWRDSGMGARLLARCAMILKAAMQRQVNAGVIPHNPVDGVEKPSARTRKPLTVWSDAQIDRFLIAAEADRLAAFWFLTLAEGMRRGEALGLRWSDLTWGENEMTCVATVRRTIVPDLSKGGAALVQDRTKTAGSSRSLLLTADTLRVLKAHRDRQMFERATLGDAWSAGDAIVTTTIGTIVTPSSIKRDLKRLIVNAGVPPLTTHGLRHCAAAVLLRNGISPALVAQRLGHSDIGTTVDRYGHLAVGDQGAAVAAMEAVIGRGRLKRTGTNE